MASTAPDAHGLTRTTAPRSPSSARTAPKRPHGKPPGTALIGSFFNGTASTSSQGSPTTGSGCRAGSRNRSCFAPARASTSRSIGTRPSLVSRTHSSGSTPRTKRFFTPPAARATRQRSSTNSSCAPLERTTCRTARTCATSRAASASVRPSASAKAPSRSMTCTKRTRLS